MTPPPEQYVIDARPRLLGRAAAATPGRLGFAQSVLPAVDAAALVLLAGVLHVLYGPITPGSLILLGLTFVAGVPGWAARAVNYGAVEDLGSITKRIVGAYALAAAFTALTGSPAGPDTVIAGGLAWPLLFGGRMAARSAQRAVARSGRRARTLVLGTGEAARTIVASLNENADYGLEVVGAIGSGTPQMKERLGTRVLGTVGDMIDLVTARRIETVVVAFDSSDDAGTVTAVRQLLTAGVDVWVVPRFFEVGSLSAAQHIGALPVVRLRPAAARRPGWRLKRAVDVVVAAAGLIVTAPLFLLISLAIKADSRGPVFFRQERVGLGGRTFRMLKFRSMAPSTILREQTEWEPAADEITRIGRLLRASGLDELPQLINVLRGDLTLVGPRPERPVFVKIFDDMYRGYDERHRVPAGITGWAQVHGLRGDTSIEDRARFDNHYIENWSFGADLKILLLTFRTLLKRYRPPAPGPAKENQDEATLADVG